MFFIRSVDTLNACVYSEIRTRIPETISWDYNFEQAGSAPLTFTVKVQLCSLVNCSLSYSDFCLVQASESVFLPIYHQSSALKEAIDDLEWPGSSVQISLQKSPPCVTFRGEGHGDLQVLLITYFLL